MYCPSMKYFKNIILLLIDLLQLQILHVNGQNAFNFVIYKFDWPGGISEQKMQFFVNPVNFNPGLQLVDINFSSPIPAGNNVMMRLHIDADTQLRQKEMWVHLLTIHEEMCKLFDIFLGQLIFDIERALGIIPRSCPIRKGIYHAINHTIDFKTLKLQTFPYGNIRFRVSGIEKSTKENLFKLLIIFHNRRI